MLQKKIQKYGHKRGKQRYRCCLCGHQFCYQIKHPKWIKQAYQDYVYGKQTLKELSFKYCKSIPTLRKYFDGLMFPVNPMNSGNKKITLIFDATFFGRTDGLLVFRAQQKNLFWKSIRSETIKIIAECFDYLDQQGARFNSFTIDGRKGVIQLLKTRYPDVPIQLCQFHQAQIIRRYTTNNPKLACAIELKGLMRFLTEVDEPVFKSLFETLYELHVGFLKERNEQGQFKHRRLRSAFRSLKTNLPYLFTYKKFPELNIPNTTNSCDGSFAHWKQKVKIHRGLKKHRRNKMINFLLDNQ